MRILVVGAGAVGSFLGAMLAAAGADVTLVDRRPAAPTPSATGIARTEPGAGTSATLVVEGDGARPAVTVRRIASIADLTQGPDVVLVAVKMFDLVSALGSLDRWPLVPVLTVQNGIGAEELAAGIRSGPVIAGSLTTAVEPAGEGRVRRLRRGGIGLAVASGDAQPVVERLVQLFVAGGLPARSYDDAAAMKWSKLLGNMVANATSAILDLEPEAIYADARLFAIERAQVRETLRVMAALGRSPIALQGADARLIALAFRMPPRLGRLGMARAVRGARGGKWPSLALHVQAGWGVPTEAPWLNGGVALAGSRLNVGAPVNATLARLVDEVASNPERRAWFRGRPDRLVAEVNAASRG